MSKGIARAVAAVVALGALAFAAVAIGAPPNGGFERGDFKGWKVENNEDGAWFVYDQPPDLREAARGFPVAFPDPPQGRYAAAVMQDGPGARFLHRRLKLRKNRRIKLSFYVFYSNGADRFYTPRHFRAEAPSEMPLRGLPVEPNQQYRIDLLRKKAPLRSLRKRDIVKTLFRTKVGDPQSLAPNKLRFNLTRFAGRTLKLRFAEVDNQEVLYAGTDAVRLVQKKKRKR